MADGYQPGHQQEDHLGDLPVYYGYCVLNPHVGKVHDSHYNYLESQSCDVH